MTHFTPAYFFDLSYYEHATLFDGLTHVWEALNRLETYLSSIPLGKIEGFVSDQAYLVDPELISIGAGAVVEPGAYIQGPCILGPGTIVRHGAYIRGNVVAGNHCVIGHDTEIKHSILLNQVQAAHFAYLGNAILGNRVNLGAGTKCANLRLDHKEIIIHEGKERTLTGLKKLGCIAGDASQLGCNSVTNPGTLLGKEVYTHPCTVIGGFVPSRSTVKSAPSSIHSR